MKLNTLIFVASFGLFLFSPSTLICAERKNDAIGLLDMSALKESVKNKGVEFIRQAITVHVFQREVSIGSNSSACLNIPFCISHRLQNDNSLFFQEVFDKMNAMPADMNFVSRNAFNNPKYDKKAQKYGMAVKSGTYIDDCTVYHERGAFKAISTRFYDKDVLLSALNQINAEL